ncbi:MAG: hypothetical protein AAF492_18850 [Verrucomicrobiota bacterium]
MMTSSHHVGAPPGTLAPPQNAHPSTMSAIAFGPESFVEAPEVGVDDDDGHHYIVLRMPISSEFLKTEQISIFLGDGYVITMQERPGDSLDPVRARLREGRSRIRGSGAPTTPRPRASPTSCSR